MAIKEFFREGLIETVTTLEIRIMLPIGINISDGPIGPTLSQFGMVSDEFFEEFNPMFAGVSEEEEEEVSTVSGEVNEKEIKEIVDNTDTDTVISLSNENLADSKNKNQFLVNNVFNSNIILSDEVISYYKSLISLQNNNLKEFFNLSDDKVSIKEYEIFIYFLGFFNIDFIDSGLNTKALSLKNDINIHSLDQCQIDYMLEVVSQELDNLNLCDKNLFEFFKFYDFNLELQRVNFFFNELLYFNSKLFLDFFDTNLYQKNLQICCVLLNGFFFISTNLDLIFSLQNSMKNTVKTVIVEEKFLFFKEYFLKKNNYILDDFNFIYKKKFIKNEKGTTHYNNINNNKIQTFENDFLYSIKKSSSFLVKSR